MEVLLGKRASFRRGYTRNDSGGWEVQGDAGEPWGILKYRSLAGSDRD